MTGGFESDIKDIAFQILKIINALKRPHKNNYKE